jgi:intein/homing endonuclease
MKRGRSSARESNLKKEALNRLKTDTDVKSAASVTSSNLVVPIQLDSTKITFSREDIRRGIRLPDKLTHELAEDIGIQIGDGSVLFYNYADGDIEYRVECYGHITEDEKYLKEVVIKLKENLFNLRIGLRYHKKAGTCYLKIRSKALVGFYKDIIGLPLGKKLNVCIPEEIMGSTDEILSSCLRGLADTDSSLTFLKKYKSIHYYPVIHFTSSSKILVEQFSEALNRLGIPHNTIFDCKQYDKRTGKTYIKSELFVCGKKNLALWMKVIGFHNPSYITRYEVWKKFGFCPPKTTVKQRILMLKGKIDPICFERSIKHSH